MNEKFSLTKNKKMFFGKTLLQIKAEVSFNNVEKGDLGGWLEKEENLSQYGGAWVYGDARVFGDAWVSGNARVFGDAQVFDNARVYGDAQVFDNARVFGDARVFDNAWVFGDARVFGGAWVYGDARVSKKLKIIAGSFFGIRWKGEEIKYIQIDDDVELIYKGEARFEEEIKETIRIGGVEYDKADVEERLRGIKPVN